MGTLLKGESKILYRDEELIQPLDRSFNWECFSPKQREISKTISDNTKIIFDDEELQAQYDHDQHYDIDGVSFLHGKVFYGNNR